MSTIEEYLYKRIYARLILEPGYNNEEVIYAGEDDIEDTDKFTIPKLGWIIRYNTGDYRDFKIAKGMT